MSFSLVPPLLSIASAPTTRRPMLESTANKETVGRVETYHGSNVSETRDSGIGGKIESMSRQQTLKIASDRRESRSLTRRTRLVIPSSAPPGHHHLPGTLAFPFLLSNRSNDR